MTTTETPMVRAAIRVGSVVAVLAAVVAAGTHGLSGALTALGATAFVTVVFAVTGRSLGWAADRGPAVVQAVALGGFFLRLVLYAALLVVLRPVKAIDAPVLAISAAVAMVAILAWETRLVLTHREFWFVDAAATVAPPPRGPMDRKERA